MSETILVERPDRHVARVSIDNPPSNALGDGPRPRLIAALRALGADTEIRAVIVTGVGKHFCAGDDIREVATRGPRMMASLAEFQTLYDLAETLRPPVIAAVNGSAFGGGLELALGCDIRIAAASARFSASSVNMGLIASAGRLPRLIGEARAKAMLMTGQPVDAASALAAGLVTAVYDDADLPAAALDLARQIASRAPLSVETIKRTIRGGGRPGDIDTLVASNDHREAFTAFLEKRPPRFTRS